MEKFNTNKILQFQILQRSAEHVEVLVVIDEELRNVGPTVDELFGELRKKFEERFKNKIQVDIMEVEKIEKPADLDTPAPVVTSMVHLP